MEVPTLSKMDKGANGKSMPKVQRLGTRILKVFRRNGTYILVDRKTLKPLPALKRYVK